MKKIHSFVWNKFVVSCSENLSKARTVRKFKHWTQDHSNRNSIQKNILTTKHTSDKLK